jgi:hypothetical protein
MQNESIRQEFSQMLAQSDMGNVSKSTAFNADTVPNLMQELNNKFNTQEFTTQRNTSTINTVATYSDELVMSNEYFTEQMDEIMEHIEDLRDNRD